MSDDLPPVVECVHIEDARRHAEGRTLVNLDAVDFAAILPALEALAEAARQCAGLITADGRTGSAGSRLLSQTAERWGAFETAVVIAGLVSADLTPNALLLTCDGEPPRGEQLQAIVYELWDLISHHRRGRFGDAAGLGMLAKQADAVAELLVALTPSVTPPAAPTPPPLPEDESIALAAGGFTLRGKLHTLTGRPYQMLRALLEARHRTLTANQLREQLGIDDEALTYPEQAVKDAAQDLRAALRNAAGMSKKEDPLPHTGRRELLSYSLKLDSHPNLSE